MGQTSLISRLTKKIVVWIHEEPPSLWLLVGLNEELHDEELHDG